MNTPEPLQQKFENRRRELAEQARQCRVDLPLRYLRQQAHYTTPAGNYDIVLKAIERGAAAVPRILTRFGIAPEELAETLQIETDRVQSAIEMPPSAPLVLVDGEDAQALRDDIIKRGRENAVRAFRTAAWGDSLRFYRPSGLDLDYCVEDIVSVITRAGEGCTAVDFPIDGIIFPKLQHPDELEWVCDLLASLEGEIGLAENQIKLQFLVESGWAVANLRDLVMLALPRLTGIILGNADYSSDVMLPEIRTDHPNCDWVRYEMVNIAGASGVPAIDNMTINYPVADANLSDAENKSLLLTRMKECFDDANHGIRLGMSGKWVGHPVQLFITLLAYDNAFPQAHVLNEIQKIEMYEAGLSQERGTAIIQGVMTDRAMDRHSKALLRKAVAWGKVPPAKAEALGIISAAERQALENE